MAPDPSPPLSPTDPPRSPTAAWWESGQWFEPPPTYVPCGMCGGTGSVPTWVRRRDWVAKGWGKGKGKGKGKGDGKGY